MAKTIKKKEKKKEKSRGESMTYNTGLLKQVQKKPQSYQILEVEENGTVTKSNQGRYLC